MDSLKSSGERGAIRISLYNRSSLIKRNDITIKKLHQNEENYSIGSGDDLGD